MLKYECLGKYKVGASSSPPRSRGSRSARGTCYTSLNTPPQFKRSRRVASARGSRRYVHDSVSQREELGAFYNLSKEVGQVVDRADEWDADLVLFHQLADEEMTSFYVLHARVVLWVVRHVDRGLVVNEQIDGT